MRVFNFLIFFKSSFGEPVTSRAICHVVVVVERFSAGAGMVLEMRRGEKGFVSLTTSFKESHKMIVIFVYLIIMALHIN